MRRTARQRARTATAMLMVALAGCASPGTPHAPYVGVFTGEVIDGRRVVRFPPIDVVGRRSDIEPAH